MNEVLLIFVVLGIGLLVGKLRIGSFQIGNTIGVLFTALLFGQIGFTLTSSAGNIAFMLFIFAVGIEAGPHFFSVFLRDGLRYISLSLVILSSALLLTFALAKLFDFGPGLAAGLLAGAAALAARYAKNISLLALLGVILSYQIIGTAFEWALCGNFFLAVQDFRMGIPGMLIQWFGGYALLKAIAKK